MSDSDSVEFEVNLDRKTFRKYHLHMWKKRPIIYIGPFIVLMLLTQIFLDGIPVENLTFVDVLPVIVILSVFFILLPYSIIRNINKTFDSNKALQERALYRVDHDTVYIKGESYENAISLSNFVRVKEYNEFILLFQANNLALYIPKSSLPGDKLHRLQKILNENIGLK